MADKKYLVLARKWRPQRFEDVVGQEHITRTLKNAISSGRIHHAFLFIGSRGIGKTTTARILAKALNCLAFDTPTTTPCGECSNCRSIGEGNNIDVIEIDGASNNGVDDVREIRDNIRMVPSNGRYKVYIIDEVHQLSLSAFNALLKTLEEPPPHAIFVLATTEAHKLPATIISRCQRYDFRRVPVQGIIDLLRGILDKEGVQATDEALHAIARAAEGGIRDAESILDELITYCDGIIDFKDVFEVLGLVDWHVLHTLCEAILDKDVGRELTIVEDTIAGGKDLSQFVQEILRYFRNLLVCRTANAAELLHLPEDELQDMEAHAQRFSLTQLIRLVEQFTELISGFDSQLAQRIALESLLIRVSKVGVEVSVETVIEKLLQLSEGGLPSSSPAPSLPRSTAAETPHRGRPDPPEAGAAPVAQAAPATVRREVITSENVGQFWPRLMNHAGRQSLNLGIWLGEGTPAGLDGATLIIAFGAQSTQARGIVDKVENRAVLNASLEALTENLRAFRTDLAESAEEPEELGAPEDQPSLLLHATANPEAARAALADPAIAHVVDLFKGRIIDVRREVPAGDVPETE